MNPARVRRDALQRLTDLPNVGPSVAGDLRLLGIELPQQLAGWNAWEMYAALCSITQQQHDPCVIDIFLSLTDFMAGGDPKPWWHYTAQRKARRDQVNLVEAISVRQVQGDAKTTAVTIEQGNASAMGFSNFAGQCQTQAGAVAFGGVERQ